MALVQALAVALVVLDFPVLEQIFLILEWEEEEEEHRKLYTYFSQPIGTSFPSCFHF